MSNPYEILGVPENASIEQVRQAYKDLTRKFSKEKYEGNPLSEMAQRRMKEIDDAYDEIIAGRSIYEATGRQSAGAYGADHFSQNEFGYSKSEFTYIRDTLNSGRINDAETLLDGIPPNARTAEWFFLKGFVQHRKGWMEEAYKNYEMAVRMEPNNREYAAALNNVYSSRSGGYKTARTHKHDADCLGCNCCDPCDICTGLICADCCCECFGGDLISCC
ncbi:MAG: J domain-containing protein [Acutalibacteraceae bacterium]|jgi:curved DNA-binding protein CbpA